MDFPTNSLGLWEPEGERENVKLPQRWSCSSGLSYVAAPSLKNARAKAETGRQTFANVRIFARTVRTQAAGPRALGFWFGGSRAGPGESLFWQVPKWCRCSRSRNHTLQKPWIRHSPNWLAVKITYGGFSFFRFKLLLPFLPLSLPLSLLPALHFSFPSSLPSSSSFVSDWAVYAKD